MITTLQAEHAVRAAVDIGMGGPKLHVAEVDLNTHRIVRSLYTERFFVNFYRGISQDADSRLSSDIMRQGLAAFKQALELARLYNAEGVAAIATASLRSAANGEQFAQLIENETGIKVHIVDQNLEGKLTFEAVLAQMDVDAEHLVVWDIGGGSTQWITVDSDGTHLVGCGEEGSGAFRDFIIEAIQYRNVKEFTTPNPMSAEEIVQAEAHAYSLAGKVERRFKEKLADPRTIVVGAGNVFGYGILTMMDGKSPFSLEELDAVVLGLENKTDDDFGGGDYAFCEGSNTILVYGLMRGLGIKQMQVIPVNNADGALVYRPFWKSGLL
ncbi:MAG: Ppx/GppA phosphatase family protein [Parachlamydiales bacterium]